MWWVALAWAGLPPGVTPQLAPTDAPAQWREFQEHEHQPADPLVCEPLWPNAALLCFKDGPRWVTAGDVARWQTTPAALRAQVVADAPGHVALIAKAVEGRTYWTAEGPWAAAGVLAAPVVAEKLKVEAFYAASPSDGVVLFWIPGDADLDRMLAVGARKMYDALDGSVTPLVHRWSAAGWVSFAEAKPTAVPAGSQGASP